MSYLRKFGERLRAARMERGLTQGEFIELVDDKLTQRSGTRKNKGFPLDS